jgi:predicted helicase
MPGSSVCDQCGVLGGQHRRWLRKCLAEEFSSIYVFHLRGNARTSGERRRMEKDNIFGVGSRAPVAISLLVKNPQAAEHGRIHFHDIGDYLGREEKLAKIEATPAWLVLLTGRQFPQTTMAIGCASATTVLVSSLSWETKMVMV